MSMYDAKNEALSPGDRAQIQLERLQALLARLKRNVRRYRELLGDTQVESLEELGKLPVTEPHELAAAFPYGLFALPLTEVTRLQSLVGADGRQVVVGFTRNDLVNWARLVARQFVGAGATSSDVIQVCFGTGVFEKALGYMLGAERLEASVIPDDPSHIEYQLAMLRNYRTTVLVTSPGNAWELARLMDSANVDPQGLYLRTVLLSRPIPADERLELKRRLCADVRCSFGIPEVLDPGFCVECSANRFHVNEDQFLVERLNGELHVTSLCREATPLLRYRTHIACDISHVPCLCGRTGATVTPGLRTDGRHLVNEVPVYESQVAAVLARTRAAGQTFTTEVTAKGIVISLRVTPEIFSDTMRGLMGIQQEIETAFNSRLGVPAEVRLVSGQTKHAT